MLMCSLYVTSTSDPRYIVRWHGPEQAFTSRSTAHATSTTSIWHHISWSLCYSNLFNLVVSLTQPSRDGRGGGLPIVGFLNCGPTCKSNSNARPQTDLRFAWTPTIILTRQARPKKTITTRIHFRRYPTSITAPVSWISAFSMHSLLIYEGSILHSSFFFECKEVDVASSHLVLCLASILSTSALVSSLASMLAKSARTSTKLHSINISLYSSSQYQNLHPFYTIKFLS